MPTSYTSLLGLALPVTGELSGTWGDTVNNYITAYLDSSVAGTQTISGSQTAVTLTRANGASLSQAGSGATGSSQYQVINCTGNPAGTLTVTIDVASGSPALSNSTYSQTFAVVNSTSTSQSVVVRATTSSGTSTGVTLASGEKSLIAWNGSDFIKVATSAVDGVSTLSFGSTGLTPSTATSGAVTVAGTLVAASGGTGQSSYTTGDLLYATGSTTLSKLGIGINGQILTSTGTAPQWSTLSGVAVTTFSAGTTGFTPSSATSGAVTLAGTLATTNGGTGLTSFTANGVVYASSSSALTTGSALTFDGSALTIDGGSAGYIKGPIGEMLIGQDGTGLYVGEGYSVNPAIPFFYGSTGTTYQAWKAGGSEQMRLTSTGLGIGTSSPTQKLDVQGSATDFVAFSGLNTNNNAGIATSSAIKFGFTSTVGTHYATLKITEDANNDNSGGLTVSLPFGGVESTKLTLTSSGNLGLSVTPSAWYTGFKSFQAGATTALADFSSGTYLFNNWYIAASGANTYLTSNFASSYSQVSGEHRFFTAPSGTAGNAISFTQAMTLDASGNLGVGNTTPGTYGKVTVTGGTLNIVTDTPTYRRLSFWSTSNGNSENGYIQVQNDGATTNTGEMLFATKNSGGTLAERARITATGTLQLSSNYQEGVVTANTSTAYTISLASGTVQILTLTGNCTFTFPTATAGQSFILLLKQDGTGGRTVTWPAAVKWPSGTAPTITSTASKLDKYIFTADGTNWYGSNAGQNYTL